MILDLTDLHDNLADLADLTDLHDDLHYRFTSHFEFEKTN